MMRLCLCLTAFALGVAGCAQGIPPPAGTDIVLIAAGEFNMGSDVIDPCRRFVESGGAPVMTVLPDEVTEQVVHRVIVEAFCIDQHEVTNRQFAHCVAHGVCRPQQTMSVGRRGESGFVEAYGDDVESYGNHPAVGMTWENATSYCRFRGGRLPTEAEWEYTARSRGSKQQVWDENPELEDKINAGCATSAFRGSVALGACTTGVRPVGASSLDRTREGVFDLAGNVAEFTADDYDPLAYCDRSRPVVPDGETTWQELLFSIDEDGVIWRPNSHLIDTEQTVCGHEQYCLMSEGDTECVSESLGDNVVYGGSCIEAFNSCIRADCIESELITGPVQSCATPPQKLPLGPDASPGDCLRRCVEVARICIGCCKAPDVAVVCAPTTTSPNRCNPVPWCFPRQDHQGSTATVFDPSATGSHRASSTRAKVVRGGDFQAPIACEGRPTRRRGQSTAQAVTGFRCVYDVGEPGCSSQD